MVEIEKRRVRKNGFECPLHPTQMFTYVLFFGDIISYYSIDIVCLSHNWILAFCLGAIYLMLALGTVFYAYVSTKINPQDPTIQLEEACKQHNMKFDSSMYEYHCQICDSHVLAGSKHCGQCNRCTSGFDHHCRYLNNCIGEQNYD